MTRERVTVFNDRHLTGVAERATTMHALVDEAYDYVLIGSSWDERCVLIAETELRADLVQLFLPRNHGASGRRERHDQILSRFATEAAERIDVISEPSESLTAVLGQLEQGLLGIRKELDRPLRMLIDLSAMPRYFSLGVLALGLSENVASEVHVVYSEARYGEVVERSPVPVADFVSNWEAVAIPNLEGDWYPGQGRHFLVSVGFDGAMVSRIVDRWDPDEISVLFPAPGVDSEYEEYARERNEGWMRQMGIKGLQVIPASASNAIEAWRVLSEGGAVDAVNSNVYCLLAGSKPHSLALALFSLSRERPAVLYPRPTVHEEKRIVPKGVCWRFGVRDRTVL